MVQSQTLEELNSTYYQEDEDGDDGLLHDSDILDIDKAELMLGHDHQCNTYYTDCLCIICANVSKAMRFSIILNRLPKM